MPDTWARRAPLTGIVAIALFVAAFAVGSSTPGIKDSGLQVLSFYRDHKGSQTTSAILLAYGSLFFLFFAGALRATVRRAEGAIGGLSAVLFGGAVLEAAGFTIFAGLTFVLADGSHHLTPSAAQAVNAISNDLFLPLSVGAAAFLLCAGIAVLRTAVLPRWLGWIAIVLGVAEVTPAGFFALMGSALWIIVVSIVLLLRPAASSSAPMADLPGN